MKHSIVPVLAAALVIAGLSGCAMKNDEMEAQIQQHDAQLRQMQPAQADAWNQVQTMRQEIRELKGQIADLKRAGGASAIVDKLNSHDEALRQIETSMAMKFDLGAPIGPAAPAAAAPAAAPAPAPAPAKDAPTYGGLVDASAAAAPAAAAAAAPSEGTWGQETPKPKQPTAEKDMNKALYQAGIDAFNARQYDSAMQSFDDFLQNYGSDPKADKAQYYIAECLFSKSKFSDAALEYDTVITKYPKSSKVPGAYLKQGICFSKMNQSKAARARMQELIKKFPQSPEAARAKDFLKTNK